MEEITFEITKRDDENRRVEVKFAKAGKFFTREVNAVFTSAGKYDKAATLDRIAQVKQGISHKLAVGAISFEDPNAISPLGETAK